MGKAKTVFFELITLLIISAPAFFILLNANYFSMHDDQHIARLFLLDRGLSQGNLYPRWVGGLGFGFGYPLFNFYPPLIYYLGELFHLLGFSFIWSIKLVVVSGFILAAWGIYYLIKELLGRWSAVLGATIYTYFFYHSVVVYVRGALAEFFAMAILPFVFIGMHKIYKKPSLWSAIIFGISFALLILTHPLIAFPAVIFIGLFFLFLLAAVKNKFQFIRLFAIGLLIGLSLSAFFWLPSLAEKKYTLTDAILTTELADYQKHFVCPYQFWYSPWGYGGSGENCRIGLTFQLGKIPIALFILSLILFILNLFKTRKINLTTGYYLLVTFLLLFSLFMATAYSSFIWKTVSYLAYLQWPWRFMTFAALFISILAGYVIYFLEKLLPKKIIPLIAIAITVITIIKYQPYFRPQQLIRTTDKERTGFTEIAWRVSGTSYEFVPKGVKTKKTAFGTTTLAIEEKDLPLLPYNLVSGQGIVKVEKDNFSKKTFTINAITPLAFRLNTYYFPGWHAYIDGKETPVNGNNDLKLITVNVPPGSHYLVFVFQNTPVRTWGDWISAIAVLGIIGWGLKNTLAGRQSVETVS